MSRDFSRAISVDERALTATLQRRKSSATISIAKTFDKLSDEKKKGDCGESDILKRSRSCVVLHLGSDDLKEEQNDGKDPKTEFGFEEIEEKPVSSAAACESCRFQDLCRSKVTAVNQPAEEGHELTTTFVRPATPMMTSPMMMSAFSPSSSRSSAEELLDRGIQLVEKSLQLGSDRNSQRKHASSPATPPGKTAVSARGSGPSNDLNDDNVIVCVDGLRSGAQNNAQMVDLASTHSGLSACLQIADDETSSASPQESIEDLCLFPLHAEHELFTLKRDPSLSRLSVSSCSVSSLSMLCSANSLSDCDVSGTRHNSASVLRTILRHIALLREETRLLRSDVASLVAAFQTSVGGGGSGIYENSIQVDFDFDAQSSVCSNFNVWQMLFSMNRITNTCKNGGSFQQRQLSTEAA